MLKFNPLKTLPALALLLCVLVACQESGSSDTKTLKSSDGKYQLTVPSDWTSRTGNPNELIGAKSPSGGIAVGIFSESKVDLADDITLDKYTEVFRANQLKSSGSDATTPGPVNNDADRQYEITITTDGAKARCLDTVSERSDRFFHISACALPSKFDENKAVIKQVSESFRATADANQTSSP